MRENPVVIARLGGLFYLGNFLFAPGMVALKKIFVATDAARTVANLAANLALFKVGFAGNVLATMAYLVVTALFYLLFRHVNKAVSLTAACFSLMGCAALVLSCLFYYAPVIMLKGTAISSQGQLIVLSLRMYSVAYSISLVFFAIYCPLIGYLIFRSQFLPRILGLLMMLGAGGLLYLDPSLGQSLFPYTALSSIGEVTLLFWLLVFGVNRERWIAQAARDEHRYGRQTGEP